MKRTKKSLFTSIIITLLCLLMFIGSTLAWFTDSVSSGTNQINAGNLDIEVLHTNANVTAATSIADEENMFVDANGKAILWEPGAMSYETITVKNVGSLALKYSLAMNILDFNTVIDGTTDTGHNLTEVLKVKVLEGDNKLQNINRESVADLGWTGEEPTLDSFTKTASFLYPSETQGKSSEETFQVIVYWDPTNTDNTWNLQNGKYASDSSSDNVGQLYVKFGLNVMATQLEYESDSFDTTYDKDALIGDVGITYVKKTAQVTKNGESTTTTDETVFVAENGDVTLRSEAKVNSSSLAEVVIPNSVLSNGDNTVALNVAKDDSANANFKAAYTSNELENKDTVTYEVNVTVNGEKVSATSDLYKVSMFVGTNRIDLEMYHKNDKMINDGTTLTEVDGHYVYNKETGFITMCVKSFSPFTPVYMAHNANTDEDYHKAMADSGFCNITNILYKDGLKFTGIYEDNKYYENGLLGTNLYTVNEVNYYYVNGDLANGTYEGFLYKDGIKLTGNHTDGKYYNEGVLATGTYSNILYKDGDKFTGIDNDIYYEEGLKSTGYKTYKNKLYNEGSIYSGDYNNKHYESGVLATGTYNSILYKDGDKFTGIDNSKYYKDGVLGTGSYNSKFYVNGTEFVVTKGDLVNLTSSGISKTSSIGNSTYRVLAVNGSQIKVLKMTMVEKVKADNHNNNFDYENSNLQKTMAGYYNNSSVIPEKIKNAIVPQNIDVTVYNTKSGTKAFTANSLNNVKNYYYSSEKRLANQYVYGLTVKDIIDYIGSTTIDKDKFQEMINIRSSQDHSTEVAFWTAMTTYNELHECNYSTFAEIQSGSGAGFASNGNMNEIGTRPVFVLDLSKLS